MTIYRHSIAEGLRPKKFIIISKGLINDKNEEKNNIKKDRIYIWACQSDYLINLPTEENNSNNSSFEKQQSPTPLGWNSYQVENTEIWSFCLLFVENLINWLASMKVSILLHHAYDIHDAYSNKFSNL